MPTTSNFGWNTPADTDLVKDGALAIRTLGNNIDASMADLKGGTTGQVLSKNSNTDMDFTWVTSDDANAIQNAIVDAKGDLITATAADTPARLAVGSNGDTLVADSAATTGLRWQGNFAAGKNKLINADFKVWQRGTSFTLANAIDIYCADRFLFAAYGSGGTASVTRQTFTPGTAPVAGYEGEYFARLTNFSSPTAWQIRQRIEDVRTFAGQTVTFSFWAKAGTAVTNTLQVEIGQMFGSGGSTTAYTNVTTTGSIGTSWTRYSYTVVVPSISGKTIGAGSYLEFNFFQSSVGLTASNTIDTWGWQVEAGNVSTAFQTATGTIQGELAACQRYYFRSNTDTALNMSYGLGQFVTTSLFWFPMTLPVAMRVAPTVLEYGTLNLYDPVSATTYSTPTAVALVSATPTVGLIRWTNNTSAFTAGRMGYFYNSNSYIGVSAEL
jgi:hypothetical protein